MKKLALPLPDGNGRALISRESVIGIHDFQIKTGIELADLHLSWFTNDLTQKDTEQVALCNHLKLQVVLTTKVVAICREATEAIMDANNLEWLLGQAVEQCFNDNRIDMSEVIEFQMCKDTRAEVPCFLVVVPQGENEIVVLGRGVAVS